MTVKRSIKKRRLSLQQRALRALEKNARMHLRRIERDGKTLTAQGKAELEARKLEVAWGLAPVAARMLMALYAAGKGVPLRSYEIDQLTESDRVISNRKEPEMRQPATIRQWMWQIKKRIGPGLVVSQAFTGYWLSEIGRWEIEAIIGPRKRRAAA